MNLASTLVETVSIDYEDFNESFLTCGTCLCTFDNKQQTPKLLPCSHTICLECLTRLLLLPTPTPTLTPPPFSYSNSCYSYCYSFSVILLLLLLFLLLLVL